MAQRTNNDDHTPQIPNQAGGRYPIAGSGAKAGPSRRSLLVGAVPGLIAGNVRLAAATAAAPDAELIAVCADFYADKAEEVRINALPAYGFLDPRELAIEEQTSQLIYRMDRLLMRAADLPATTPDGLRAKATLLKRTLPHAAQNFELTPESLEIKLALSLASDVARGAT